MAPARDQPAGLATAVATATATDIGPLHTEPQGPNALGAGEGGTTASAALLSAIVLLGFATLACPFFPAGGVAVPALGVAMATLGLRSGRAKLAAIALGLHGLLLVACFLQAL